MTTAAFQAEAVRLQDSKPKIKIEFVSVAGVTTDISAYYNGGASFEQIKERAPDEIQAGDFDITLFNHDNYFSEYVSTSLIYNSQYHGAKIKVYAGFVLSDGTEEFLIQAVGLIDQITASPNESTVTFRCRDLIRRMLDGKFHNRPESEIPANDSTNVGNGFIDAVATKPFKTKSELWTITCTTAGGDGVGIFSVVGATSGNVGNATSGTEFSTGTGTGGVKFTILAGVTAWAVGDAITFTTHQYPEWTTINAAKIIWAVLTGYNWDTDTQETWQSSVFDFDHTQSDANTDLDYNSFVTVIASLDDDGSYNLTGYIKYDESAVDFLQNIILLFLGSLYTSGDGRIRISSYAPVWDSSTLIDFSDAKKITKLGYNRTIDEVINYVTIYYKKQDLWDFSDGEVDYQGIYVATDSTSYGKYDILGEGFSVRWYTSARAHVVGLANRLIAKYADPPLNIDFDTGLDALETDVGDMVTITDTKYNLSVVKCEVTRLAKNFDESPMSIGITARRDNDLTTLWGFLGSSVDEGDSISPQTATYGTATATDKLFCYLGSTGGTSPNYRMY